MKSRLFIFLMAFFLLFTSVKSAFIVGFYEYNRSVFIEIFCVNKDKPQIHCNGKCRLMKETSESSSENPFTEKASYLLKTMPFLLTNIIDIQNPLLTENRKVFFFHLDTIPQRMIPFIFRPPII